MRILTGLFLSLFMNSVFGEDPCMVLGVGVTYQEHSPMMTVCLLKNQFGQTQSQTNLTTNQILARMIVMQSAQQQELIALRSTLNTSIVQLTEAVNALKAVSIELKNGNEIWHENTLKNTVCAIEKVPSLLAKQPALVEPLIAKVSYSLANSEQFINQLKESMGEYKKK